MARPLRIEFPGALYHVTARGNARQDIYLDARDSGRFLDLLGEVCARYEWRCFAYCLMTNHYHFVVETAQPNLSAGMRQLNGRYSQAFNHRHRREGHLFQGRYKAILVEREAYLLEVCRYVVLNPVRAGLARAPQAWRWSSYRATLAGAGPAWLAAPELLGLFAPEPEAAARAYRAFIAEGTGIRQETGAQGTGRGVRDRPLLSQAAARYGNARPDPNWTHSKWGQVLHCRIYRLSLTRWRGRCASNFPARSTT